MSDEITVTTQDSAAIESREVDAFHTAAAGAGDIELVACAPGSRRLADLARRVAASECTVLIVGESGTGKEVLARFVHRHSNRANKPFVAVNCAAIPETMLEAMLFGYEKGAFTGALATHAGKFEQAQGGTLLLDEVTEMPLSLQAKLLRVLQEREVERLGGRTPVSLDVRVLATTNRRLREEVAAGRFREDLYYRLNVFPLAISPLATRRDDVLPLAMQLLSRRVRPGARVPALSADAAHLLLTYNWPGNVRELDNLLQRALILVNGPVIGPEHIQFELMNEPSLAAMATGAMGASGMHSSAPGASGIGAPGLGASRIGAAGVGASGVGASGVGASGVGSAGVGAAGLPGSGTSFPIGLPHFGGNASGTSITAAGSGGASLARTLGNTEKDLILEALRSGSPRREVAQRLGISPRTLRHKLARLREAGVEVPAA